jgi:hypothetical protein
MRKHLITVFFLLVWLCQLSGRYFIMFEFYLNQSYIAKNLCINRNNPQMHCNGHCQMKKKLSEEDKQNQENPERRVENKSEQFVPCTAIADIQPVCVTVFHDHHTPQTIGSPIDLSYTIFHPPGA